ncbi:MAG: CPBP family intramembrane metalloprotease [Deltaproteobacteria bacterium]|nr:CPBP family intramembrane metalloprotease [Deltaproteobacteria bacterium]
MPPETHEPDERERLGALKKRLDADVAKEAKRTAKEQRREGGAGWFAQPVDPLTSLVLTTPVFVIYQLGILLMNMRNGVDLVTDLMVRLLRLSVPGYLALTLAIGGGMLLAGRALKRRGHAHVFSFGRVMLESSVLAVVMLFSVGLATQALVPQRIGFWANQIGGVELGPIDKLVMAAGAGFHEELVFRVGLFGGLTWLLGKAPQLRGARAPLVAALLAATAFSAMHYIGSLSDAFTLTSFVFRLLSGLYLTLVYRTRGFAVAVYTHMLYDLGIFFWVF